AAYGLEGVALDGNDVLAVYAAAGEAVRRARDRGGPTLLECKTYRTRPHAEGMGDFTYRTREEVEEWKTRDPIARLRETLLSKAIASDEELSSIDADLRRTIEDADQFAQASGWPDPSHVTAHVFHQ